MNRAQVFENARKVVVKIGSGVLTGSHGLNLERVVELAGQIARLAKAGRQVVLVSSGAVASGQAKMGLKRDQLRSVRAKQAAAALGQSGLMRAYEEAFAAHGINVAQVLLTNADLTNRDRYNNVHNTFETLLEWGVVPVVNENDTVTTDEIKLGDNDNLASMLTILLQADLLVNLTNVNGVMDDDPRANPDAKRIALVKQVDSALLKAASAQPGAVGRGGILSKVVAAEKVACGGVPAIVANGMMDGVIDRLAQGEDLGTLFTPLGERLPGRKHWIAFTAKHDGAVVVDAGAVRAICEQGKSLLAVGIQAVRGSFDAHGAIRVIGSDQEVLGVGLSNYSSIDIERIKGMRASQIKELGDINGSEVVIHRDDLAVFSRKDEESLACLLKN